MGSSLPELARTGEFPVTEARINQAIEESLSLPQVDCGITHFFGPGIYIKECRVPAGTYAIGELHKDSCTNILVKGRVSVANSSGGFTELVAPMIFVSPPSRKMGYFHEDTIWQNVYATSETDIGKLEDMLLDKHPALANVNRQIKNAANVTHDNEDYALILKERSMTEDQVKLQVENTSDMIPLPYGVYKFTVSESPIQGRGLFATSDIEEGEIVGKARIGMYRTPIGRLMNHSKTPNSFPRLSGDGGIDIVASRRILGARGGVTGEEITVNYRDSASESVLLDKEIKLCLHS